MDVINVIDGDMLAQFGDGVMLTDALSLNLQCADPQWSGRKLTPKQQLFVQYFTDAEGPAFGNATAAARLSGYRGDRAAGTERDPMPEPSQPSPDKARKPTAKQTRFAKAYADPALAAGNATKAAKLAGYRGNNNQLGVQGHANTSNPVVMELIRATADKMVEPALQRVSDAMDATKARALMHPSGQIVYTTPEPDHTTRLKAAQFVFDLQAKFGARAASVEASGEIDGGVTREEAVEAATECLETFAPHLLAGHPVPAEDHATGPEAEPSGEVNH